MNININNFFLFLFKPLSFGSHPLTPKPFLISEISQSQTHFSFNLQHGAMVLVGCSNWFWMILGWVNFGGIGWFLVGLFVWLLMGFARWRTVRETRKPCIGVDWFCWMEEDGEGNREAERGMELCMREKIKKKWLKRLFKYFKIEI